MVSHTKVWANIGYAALTAAFIRDAWLGGLTDMKILAYGAVVAGSAAASKIASLRHAQAMAAVPAAKPTDRTREDA